jgi:CxxC-x17-CxxC domain-containing protein
MRRCGDLGKVHLPGSTIRYCSFPKDCLSKAMYKSDFGGQRNYGPREMTKVICSDCGKECEVPFKPTEGRPVYCQECLPKHRRPRF